MDKKAKICIVEDEVIIADSIHITLLSLGYDVPMPVADYETAIALLERELPDIAILDIKLRRGKDGIELAKYIRDNYDIPIIFLTANSDTATLERAKTVRPDAFLVKPFQKADIYAAIEIAMSNYSSASENSPFVPRETRHLAKDSIFIKDGYYFHKVRFDDINYLSSEHVYVNIHTTQKKYLVRASLHDFLDKFDRSKIVRVHQRYAVNINKVEKINSAYVVIDNEEIPVSKSYHHALLANLNIG
jgi:two-component system response regulator LytT